MSRATVGLAFAEARVSARRFDAAGSLLVGRKVDAWRAVRLHAIAAMVAMKIDCRHDVNDAAGTRSARGSGAWTALAPVCFHRWSRAPLAR